MVARVSRSRWKEKGVEVGLAQRIAVEREEGLVDPLRGEADRAAGAERLLLDLVFEPQVAVAVAEMLLDLGREVAARDDRARDAVAAQMLEGVGELRPVDERQHVLSRPVGERAQPRAEPPTRITAGRLTPPRARCPRT